MHDLDRLRRSLLDARDERAAAVARVVEEHMGRYTPSSLVVVSLNIPGPDKSPPGCDALFDRAMTALRAALPGARPVLQRLDALGPWAAVLGSQPPAAAKLTCMGLEENLHGGRLLDLDVFGSDGGQVDRAAMGLPPRRCLACDQPASDCIRLRRHEPADLEAALQALLS